MASFSNRRTFGMAPLFAPEEGVTVMQPPGEGRRYWSGGLSALYDEVGERFCLYYRVRTPQARGGPCRVAESANGTHFETVWEGSREQFDSPSIEKASLFRTSEGRFRLYVSYVDARTYKWRIDLLEADGPEGLDPAHRTPVPAAGDCANEGVKDPVTRKLARRTICLRVCHPARSGSGRR